MKRSERLQVLVQLGAYIKRSPEELLKACQQAEIENPWFTQDSIQLVLNNLADWLQESVLEDWAKQYQDTPSLQSEVGVIMAGNIPLVGFHDWLCVFLSGQKAILHLSEKDQVLLKHLLMIMNQFNSTVGDFYVFDKNFKKIDALIATGSSNSIELFKQYFKSKPSLLRSHRNSIAVIHGDETDEEILKLGEDCFTHFGLGCRNVSFLLVPEDYVFDKMFELWHEKYQHLVFNNKYKNNFDYQYAILLLNKEDFLTNGMVIIRESESMISPLATLHYKRYHSKDEVYSYVHDHVDHLQCIVAKKPLEGVSTVLPGMAQHPFIDEYADGKDTMLFIEELIAK